ncbi:MAG: Mur ligase family protein [Bacteroidota bacterium]
MQRIHMIAIGGSVMHNLALALQDKGFEVSGSDDEIFDPARQRLADAGLLPNAMGWNPDRISDELDAVIMGMHAKQDNPELKKAQELGIKIYSFPEFIYQESIDKQRIVIAGSHGKTTISAMVIHVLHHLGRETDYLLGADITGLDRRVRLSQNAPTIVIEGDEYSSSALDSRPKFLNYHHHIALVSGIAWDHINVYPDEQQYIQQFELLAKATPQGGALVFNGEDPVAANICKKEQADVSALEYAILPHVVKEGVTYLTTEEKDYPLRVFGKHNLANMAGAMRVCEQVGVSRTEFYEAIQTFTGASSRLELMGESHHSRVYKDFAHAPSKVVATVKALNEQFPERTLVVALELHTYSSLDPRFIGQYGGSLDEAHQAAILYNVQVAKNKGRDPLSNEAIVGAFGREDLQVFNDANALATWIRGQKREHQTTALLSSGNFNGLPIKDLAKELLS